MSNKIEDKARISGINRPGDVRAPSAPPPRQVGALRPPGPITPKHRPVPLKIPKEQLVPFAIFETDQKDLEALRSVVTDEVNYEIARLYSTVSKVAETDDSAIVRVGLKALEENIKLREYIHVHRTNSL